MIERLMGESAECCPLIVDPQEYLALSTEAPLFRDVPAYRRIYKDPDLILLKII